MILAACALCGADEVWGMGGAHAVAAFAYGTESVARVDVIAGPGSLYVQEAKRQVSGDVGIDGFAGPTDVLIVATEDADVDLVVADLLAQAEHGIGTIVALVTDVGGAGARGRRAAGRGAGLRRGGRGRWSSTTSRPALAVAEAFAPEHLELVGAGAEALAGARALRRLRVRRAASAGPRSATTSPAPTTRCRPAAPRGSPPGCRRGSSGGA